MTRSKWAAPAAIMTLGLAALSVGPYIALEAQRQVGTRYEGMTPGFELPQKRHPCTEVQAMAGAVYEAVIQGTAPAHKVHAALAERGLTTEAQQVLTAGAAYLDSARAAPPTADEFTTAAAALCVKQFGQPQDQEHA